MNSLIINISENILFHIREQNLDVIMLLLKYDKNFNYSSIIYNATYYGFFELIKILVEDYKIDINILNEYGENLLYTATKQKFFHIALYFIKNGINTDAKHFHHGVFDFNQIFNKNKKIYLT